MSGEGTDDHEGGIMPIARALNPWVKRLPKKSAAGVSLLGLSFAGYRYGSFADPVQELVWSWACLLSALASGYLIFRPVFKMKD